MPKNDTSFRERLARMILGRSADHWFRRGTDLIEGGGAAGGMARPFEQSVWVMRAIKKTAEPIQAVSLVFSGDKRGGRQRLENPELARFWEMPALGMTGPIGMADTVEASVGWLKLEGEFFWLLGDEWLTNRFASSRAGFAIARPDRMRAIVRGTEVIGWDYLDARGKSHTLLPEQVIHRKFWNPYDDIRGLAEYKAGAMAADADFLQGRFARNLAANNNDQGVYVVAKGGMPTDEQQAQIVRALREKRALASRGEFRPVFLTGDLAVEDPKVHAVDAQFAAQRIGNRHEIALAFGVPPSMFDVKASYSEGASSDRFILIEDTCRPLGEKLCDAIESVTMLFFAGRPRVFASFHWDEHSVMQQVRAKRLESVDRLWTKGMPMREINEYLALGIPEYPGWDRGYLPIAALPVDEVGEVDEDGAKMPDPAPAAAGEKRGDPLGRMLAALEDPATLQMGSRVVGEGRPDGRAPEGKASRLWAGHMRRRRPWERRIEAAVNRHMFAARADTLSNLAQAQGAGLLAAKVAPGVAPSNVAAVEIGGEMLTRDPSGAQIARAIAFRLDKLKNGLWGTIKIILPQVMEAAALELLEELGQQENAWTDAPADVLRFLQERENFVGGVSDDVHREIMQTIEQSIADGDGFDEMAAKIRGRFNALGAERAQRIAVTETGVAYGRNRHEAMQRAGIAWKQWLSSQDDNVRPDHVEAHRQIVPIDAPFKIGGEMMQHPCEAGASAKQVINCRCIEIAVTGPDDDGL